MGPIHSFDDLFDLLWRRRLIIAFVTMIGSVASILFALSQPLTYAATEVIQIERPTVTDELAPTTVAGSSARRLQLIQQRLTARDTIVEVIEKFGLFDHLPALSEAEQITLFRESLTIEGVAAAREGAEDDGTIAALSIRAEFGTPEHARDVAHEMATRTIALSAAARQEKSRAALDFFLQEEAALEQAITSLEEEVALFRSQNAISTTGRIEVQQSELATLNDAILTVERSKIALERELGLIDQTSVRPATQRRQDDLNRQLLVLDEQHDFLNQRLAEVRDTLSASPEVESRINIFERRLEQYQNELEVISSHRRDAEVGYRLEQNRQSETMSLLERATVPEEPAGGARKKIAIAGGFASVMLAFGIAAVLDMCRPVIRSSAQMQRELGIVPAMSIPAFKTKRGGLIKRLFLWVFNLIVEILLLPSRLLSAIWRMIFGTISGLGAVGKKMPKVSIRSPIVTKAG